MKKKMFLCRVFFGAEAAAPPRWQGNVPDRGHLQEHIYRNTAAPKNTEKKMVFTTFTGRRQIIPSQMEVAPLHCTVDITQKRSRSKNTKKIENM